LSYAAQLAPLHPASPPTDTPLLSHSSPTHTNTELVGLCKYNSNNTPPVVYRLHPGYPSASVQAMPLTTPMLGQPTSSPADPIHTPTSSMPQDHMCYSYLHTSCCYTRIKVTAWASLDGTACCTFTTDCCTHTRHTSGPNPTHANSTATRNALAIRAATHTHEYTQAPPRRHLHVLGLSPHPHIQ
jgi:hypothetical protein